MRKPETDEADTQVTRWGFITAGNFLITAQWVASEFETGSVTHETGLTTARGIGSTTAALGVLAMGRLLQKRRDRDALRSSILRTEEETTLGINMIEPASYKKPKFFSEEWFFNGELPSTTESEADLSAANDNQLHFEINHSPTEHQKFVWVQEKFSLVSARLAAALNTFS